MQAPEGVFQVVRNELRQYLSEAARGKSAVLGIQYAVGRARELFRVFAYICVERVRVAATAAGEDERRRFAESFELLVEAGFETVAQLPVHAGAHIGVFSCRIAEIPYKVLLRGFLFDVLEYRELVFGTVVRDRLFIIPPEFYKGMALLVRACGEDVHRYDHDKKQYRFHTVGFSISSREQMHSATTKLLPPT